MPRIAMRAACQESDLQTKSVTPVVGADQSYADGRPLLIVADPRFFLHRGQLLDWVPHPEITRDWHLTAHHQGVFCL